MRNLFHLLISEGNLIGQVYNKNGCTHICMIFYVITHTNIIFYIKLCKMQCKIIAEPMQEFFAYS